MHRSTAQDLCLGKAIGSGGCHTTSCLRLHDSPSVFEWTWPVPLEEDSRTGGCLKSQVATEGLKRLEGPKRVRGRTVLREEDGHGRAGTGRACSGTKGRGVASFRGVRLLLRVPSPRRGTSVRAPTQHPGPGTSVHSPTQHAGTSVHAPTQHPRARTSVRAPTRHPVLHLLLGSVRSSRPFNTGPVSRPE